MRDSSCTGCCCCSLIVRLTPAKLHIFAQRTWHSVVLQFVLESDDRLPVQHPVPVPVQQSNCTTVCCTTARTAAAVVPGVYECRQSTSTLQDNLLIRRNRIIRRAGEYVRGYSMAPNQKQYTKKGRPTIYRDTRNLGAVVLKLVDNAPYLK